MRGESPLLHSVHRRLGQASSASACIQTGNTGSNPVGDRTRVVHGPVPGDHQRGLDPSRGQGARTIACPSSCLPRRGKRVTKTVAKERDSPVSRGITKSHRVTGNPSILLTRPHGTARQSQLPKLDVAGSIPVAGPTNAGGYGRPVAPCASRTTEIVTDARVKPRDPTDSHRAAWGRGATRTSSRLRRDAEPRPPARSR